jgi:uncharacterized membrane protein
MDALTYIFSHVCGQGRPFVLDGEALPVCQRCLGLYAGAALTGLWLVASGAWRRALPERSAAYAHIVMLLAAMAGGVHWLDAGPTWRLVCGLWTGHVAMLWLVGGAGHFLRLAGRVPLGICAAGLRTRRADGTHALGQRGGSGDPPRETITDPPRQFLSDPPRQVFEDPPWPRGLRAQTLAAGPVLAIVAFAFTRLVSTGWFVAAALVVAGAVFLTLALVRTIVAVARLACPAVGARRRHSPRPGEPAVPHRAQRR